MNHGSPRTESETIMMFTPPIVVQPHGHEAEKTTVQLSALNDTLPIRVPDSDFFRANWDVYPILGSDPDTPEWEGLEEPTGVWDDAADDMVKVSEIELHIPKEVLQRYANKTVELRYKFADESSMEPYSAPLILHVED
jgi:hypothetical protein